MQTWALHQAIRKLDHHPILVDYCPDILADKDPLNPYGNMWDKDEESKRMVALTMPAIRINYEKFTRFYNERFDRTTQKYMSHNFDEIGKEQLDGFVCGSDTILCSDEFGFDDGYYANYPEMKGNSVSYAASFGDAHFTDETFEVLNERIKNFKALGIRENQMIPYLKLHTTVPVQRTIDPTLLLTAHDYDTIASEAQMREPYLLYYTRRYNPAMEAFAEKTAREMGLAFVDISLRATNAEKGHIMRYDAGVEEFLSLVKHASFVVTNSFHGVIFAVQYRRPMAVFLRVQASGKIGELLELFGMQDVCLTTGDEAYREIDYDAVHARIEKAAIKSREFLKTELELL